MVYLSSVPYFDLSNHGYRIRINLYYVFFLQEDRRMGLIPFYVSSHSDILYKSKTKHKYITKYDIIESTQNRNKTRNKHNNVLVLLCTRDVRNELLIVLYLDIHVKHDKNKYIPI